MTIYALSSAHGKAGVAIIRLSGASAYATMCTLVRDKGPFKPRHAYFRKLYDREENVIDQAIVLFFQSPHSFTGEDIVELHVHGSIAIIRTLLETLATFEGLRLAQPGEFTRRAFENGKLDLLAVEATSDLINAETTSQLRQAMRQLDGTTGIIYKQWHENVLKSLAFSEAIIDFAEDAHFENTEDIRHKIHYWLTQTHRQIETHLHAPPSGERIREGVEIALIGAPNVGKSSMLNWLAGRSAAIVSDIAGTTRDVIEVSLNIGGGYAVTLRDTAGMHDTSENSIEAEGIQRALQCAQNADIRIFIVSVDQPELPLIYQDLQQTGDLLVFNKIDLGRPKDLKAFICCSLQEKIGLDTLKTSIQKAVQDCIENSSFEFPVITRARHREYLTACGNYIHHALEKLDHEATFEFSTQDMRFAAQALDQIMGKTDVEHVLDQIFAQFCIGK